MSTYQDSKTIIKPSSEAPRLDPSCDDPIVTKSRILIKKDGKCKLMRRYPKLTANRVCVILASDILNQKHKIRSNFSNRVSLHSL